MELVLDFLLSAFFRELLLVASSSYFFLAFFVLKKFLSRGGTQFSMEKMSRMTLAKVLPRQDKEFLVEGEFI